MKLILLAGNSLKNKEWVQQVEASLRDLFTSTYIHEYRHWMSGSDDFINMDMELERLKSYLTSQPAEDYIVFGKSVGTILALKGIHENMLSPKKCIFVGTAIGFAKGIGANLDLWFTNYATPTLFIQKTRDPAINFVDLKKILEDKHVSGYVLVEEPGEDHFYGDLQALRRSIEPFVK